MENYKILPYKKFSYVVSDNGEPLVVFYKPNQRLFTTFSSTVESVGYFLNIRHPLLIDAKNQKISNIPEIPNECDGIIIENYATSGAKAFIVKDFSTQTMQIDL